MDQPWTTEPAVGTLHARSVGKHPAHCQDRLERTTGFEPATLTLAKVMDVVRRLGWASLSGLYSASFSAASAESAPVRSPTLNALNLYHLERWCRCWVSLASGSLPRPTSLTA